MLSIPFCFLKTSPILACIKRFPIFLLRSSSRLPSQADFSVSSSCSSQHIHLFYLIINMNIAIPCDQKSFIKCFNCFNLSNLSNVLIHLVKWITDSLKLCATFFVYTFFSEEHSLLLCSPQRTLWPEKNNGNVSILQKGLKLTVRLIRHITFDVRLCRRTQGRGQIHYRAVSAVSPQLE